jgi:diguanylate cyclase (GGDEF)-like protein/PAS domain S-box-containing protein
MNHQPEANLLALIESTEDLIWSVDLDYRLIAFNSALRRNIEETLGLRIETGMRLHELLPPERAALWPPFFERALQEGPFRVEYSLILSRILELAFNPIVMDGATTGISIFGKDITERKAGERGLEKAEAKYRSIFEGAVEGMFQTFPDGSVQAVNPALAQMLGYDSADDVNSSVKNVIQDVWADPAEHEVFAEQIGAQGAVRGFECRLKRKDATIIQVSLSCRSVCGADGRLLHHEGFIEEITERRRTENALRESEESLRESQRIAGIGSYVLEIDTGIWTSTEVLDGIFGIGQVHGRDVAGWMALIHTDDRAMMASYLTDEVVGRRNAFDKEYRIVRQIDGAERWVHGMGRLDFNVQGQPVRMRGTIQDITERKLGEMKLRDSEERYRSTFEQAAVGIVHTSFEGRFLRCNGRFAEIVGYPPDEIPGMTFQQITAPEDLDASLDALNRISHELLDNASWEKRYLRKDGSLVWVKVTVSIQRDAEGRALHSIALLEDINARKSAEERLAATQEALRTSEERYRIAFQTSLDAININRMSDGMCIECNKAFLDITGYEREEVIGRTSLELNIWADPRNRHRLVEILRQNSSCRDLEVEFRKKNGDVFWGQMSASLIDLDGVACILSMARDISDAKEAEDRIKNLAFYDSLTGLPNRRLLLERLRQSLAATPHNLRKQALLLVDLDNFKTLNETLGHQIGDLLLQEAARRLVACLGEAGTVARLGGDEFVVMLEDLNATAEVAAAQAKSAGKSILAAIGLSYSLAGRACRSTASIGITVFGDLLVTAEEILQQADIALDQAKTAGRDTIHFFAPALQAAVNARATLENDLRQAIKTNQFVLHYQPQVDCDRLIGAEALIRWNHPQRGLLAPGEFIPLAEETGLILPLGEWVLETACAQIAAWAERIAATNIRIAINISARQFRQPEFVPLVLAALDRTRADPQKLELELTESMLVESIEDVIAKMTYLKSHGLRFSLDDFGTGYSSLAYLKRLPLDLLKIDRSFVHDILVDAGSGAIAQTILSLSKAMGLPVIAEGVETEEQREFLSGLGCHSFQGYLFSRPLPLEEFERLWLNSARCAAQLLQ